MNKIYFTKNLLGSFSFFLYLYAIFVLVQSPNLEAKFNNDKNDSNSWFSYLFQLEKSSFQGYKNLIVGLSINFYIAVVFYFKFFNWLMKLFDEMSIQNVHKAEIMKCFAKFIPACVFPLSFILICQSMKDLDGPWVTGLVLVSLTILQIVLDNEEDGGLVHWFRIDASVYFPITNKRISDALILSAFCGTAFIVEEVSKWVLNSLKPQKSEEILGKASLEV